jgi:(p)ppGpp synthase/HD superfamily hydrolase
MIALMWTPEAYLRALHFAAERHAGQTVPGTEMPYLVHLVSVAAEVMRGITLEPVEHPDLAVTCALLHDSVEDTHTTADEVAAAFGADVARGVVALSKDPSLPKDAQLDDSLARIRTCPREIWAVKLADRITNLQRPPARWNDSKRRRYQEEARRIHAALASGHAALGARLAHMIEGYTLYLDP